MAPVTRQQASKASKASVLKPKKGNDRALKKTKQQLIAFPVKHASRKSKRKIKKAVKQPPSIQQFIVDTELRDLRRNLSKNYKRRIDRGLSENSLVQHIENALHDRKPQEVRWEKKIKKIRRTLEIMVGQQNNNEVVMSEEQIANCLVQKLYDSLRTSHLSPTTHVSSSTEIKSETPHEALSSPVDNAHETTNKTTAIAVTNIKVLNAANDDSEIVLNEPERSVKLAFKPKSGRDVMVEGGLLEILHSVGQHCFKGLSYDDYIRLIQVVKVEDLARIKIEIDWNPIEEQQGV